MRPFVGPQDDPAGYLTGWGIPRELEGWHVKSAKGLQEAVWRALGHRRPDAEGVVAIDVETIGVDPWRRFGGKKGEYGVGIFGLSFAWREDDKVLGRYVPLRHKFDKNLALTDNVRGLLRDLLFDDTAGVLRVGHNFRFDAGFFCADQIWGKVPAAPVECTQTLAWLDNEERLLRGYSLASLSRELLPATGWKGKVEGLTKKTMDWSELPVENVGPYAAQDARSTLLIWEALDASLKAQDAEAERTQQRHLPLSYVRGIERDATPIIWGMEMRGMALDFEYAQDALDKCLAGEAAAEAQMAKLLEQAGHHEYLPVEPTKTAWISRAALALGYTPKAEDIQKSGDYSTSSAAFQRAGFGDHPFVGALFRWRSYHKAMKSYFEPFVRRATPDRCGTKATVIHPEIFQNRARSGRLQARNPNLMNLPLYKVGLSRSIIQIFLKRGEGSKASHGLALAEYDTDMAIADELNVRACLKPRPGYAFVAADYAQQELRAFAEVCQEPKLMQVFKDGRDPHAESASAIAVPPDPKEKEAYSQFRSIGKLCNFLLIFGGGADRYYETAEYDMRVELEIEAAEKKARKKASEERKDAYRMARRAQFLQEAERHIEAYHAKYTRIRPFHRAIKRVGQQRGYITNKYGRRRRKPAHLRYFPVTRWYNFVIQGSCADMLRERLVHCNTVVQDHKLDAHPVLTTHDEILFECKLAHVQRLQELLQEHLPHPTGWELTFPTDINVNEKGLGK